MDVRYLKSDGTVDTIASVTRVQPVGTLELLIETVTTQTPIKVTALVDVTP